MRKDKTYLMVLRDRKSQAALEFIMTYGWAILVVLVAIGALAYFGVLSPDRFLPSKCTLQPGIACTDFKITPTVLTLYIQNSLGRDIGIDCAKAQLCGTQLGANCNSANPPNLGTMSNGGTLTLDLGTAGQVCNFGSGKYNGAVNITYTILDTSIQHVNQGQITGKIE